MHRHQRDRANFTTEHWRCRSRLHIATLAAVLATFGWSATASAQTLERVKARGSVNCGINPELLGFSTRNDKGIFSGFDVDLCRALAAAIFNDPGKVQYTPLDTADRLSALQAGKIDVLSRNTTWTFSREASLKLNFAAVTYYDGQGFLVRRAMNVTSALELDGATICVQKQTTSELNAADYFRNNNMKFQVLSLANANDAVRAYDEGKCTVLTSDTSQLFAERLRLKSPDEHVVLPDIISKEPLGPAVRFGDDQWLNIVKWTHYAMLNAEELGVNSATLQEALKSTKPDVKRLVGTDDNYGEHLGLTKDWAARIIGHVGNYGEVFERNVGTGSRLGIPRGINSLWSNGGIQYAPPIR
jgi:general L-amino acid transport system substrate-binding protein